MTDVVINRTTFEALAVPSLSSYPVEDWVHNPDLSEVSGINKKYWKVVDDTVVEMDQSEKDAVDVENSPPETYLIELDSIVADKDFRAINYKTELNSGVCYTPVFTFHTSGAYSGLLDCTKYYKDYVNPDDKGTLIIDICETYELEYAPELYNSVRAVISRTKTWRYTKQSDGELDLVNTKQKTKLYDTRLKRHNETIRRRENILEQLIDNVGTAGLLSGTFANVTDAHQKLIEIQIAYGSEMSAWVSSGHGTIYDLIENDTLIAWANDIVADTPYTQAMVPWMIGWVYRDYIAEKIKGNVH